MAWSLICPANRGIGYYLTRHLLQNTKLPVVATTRKDIDARRRAFFRIDKFTPAFAVGKMWEVVQNVGVGRGKRLDLI